MQRSHACTQRSNGPSTRSSRSRSAAASLAVGFVVRRRVEHWTDPGRLDGKAIVVTGASSGIGQAAAIQLAALGAEVWLVGRDAERLRNAAGQAETFRGSGPIHTAEVDVVDAAAVSGFVDRVASTHDQIHALIHNAGALFPTYGLADDGAVSRTERTLATHVLAPFRLSWLLSPLLLRAERSVIATVTSGGMYTQRFDPDHIEVGPEGYRGAVTYGKAKRGAGCAVPRMGPTLGWSRRGQLRGPPRLGGYTRSCRWTALLRQARPVAPLPSAGCGHGDMAGG